MTAEIRLTPDDRTRVDRVTRFVNAPTATGSPDARVASAVRFVVRLGVNHLNEVHVTDDAERESLAGLWAAVDVATMVSGLSRDDLLGAIRVEAARERHDAEVAEQIAQAEANDAATA